MQYFKLSLLYWNTIPQLAEGIMIDLKRDFWMRETGTGQQVVQHHDRYIMMMIVIWKKVFVKVFFKTFPILKHLDNKTVESQNSRILKYQERI
jgi:hypothetical protein